MEGSAYRPCSYIRHHRNGDIVEGQCCNDKDNEEGQVSGYLPPNGCYYEKLESTYQIV